MYSFDLALLHIEKSFVGGMSEEPQLQAIRRGARLIVATPGRLEDYLTRRLVKLGDVKMLAMIGAFLGLRGALLTIILGAFAGSVIGLAFIKVSGKDTESSKFFR